MRLIGHGVVVEGYLPEHIGGIQDLGMGVAIEEQVARGAAHVDGVSSCQFLEGNGKAGSIPLDGGAALAADHGAHIVGEAWLIGLFAVGHLLAVHQTAVWASFPCCRS